MPISVGSQAPDFTLKTKTAEGFVDVTLSSNFGKKNTLILFFPGAFTGICTDEMCGIASGQFLKTDDNTQVYGISVDGPLSQEAWAKANGITTTLLSDFGKKVIHDYGVVLPDFLGTNGEAAARAAFVVDKEGTIRYAEQTATPRDMPNWDAIRECLAGL